MVFPRQNRVRLCGLNLVSEDSILFQLALGWKVDLRSGPEGGRVDLVKHRGEDGWRYQDGSRSEDGL